MKKIHYLTIAAVALAGLAVPVTSLAADGGQYTSNGAVTFEANTDPTKPVDPTNPVDPIKPVDPTDPNGPKPGTNGPLSIDYASSLDFGTQKITSTDEVYKAKAQKYLDKANAEKTGPNFVQVTDNRGLETGWNLQVKQNGQFKTAENQELTGAAITFKNGNVVTNSSSEKPAGQATIKLSPDNALTNVMSAADGQGAGTYLLAWGTDAATGAESIELAVPGSTTKYAKQYKTTFTWVLADTPPATDPIQ
ncbi:WxL domain-containing protein [Enterococcus pallens]|uniref:Cell surface protein n=1 Tax=Enterococcus pallens ATCC BAA-351 TaxID=1158607 RepID=R2SDH2_9ENTE|nr:WxL domain-containing protein [Enterococcus pallens]EOH93565.1 cell surface protein [Enterococcus pallens ATCC BAA-351]EOU24405.1 cell surface protein [Enterococcus pallens ATCC BAA-351]OJG76394.1 cell surface protein [Enterococcus pallens]